MKLDLAGTIARAVTAVRSRRPKLQPKIGLVLGSGMARLAEPLEDACRVPYPELGMCGAAVPGHPGTLVLGSLAGVELVVMQGRVHLYEGRSPDEVVLGVRVMIALGARTLILTNAAGGIREALGPGSLMLIEDHLNLTGHNCLVGGNDETLGPRFLALDGAYDPGLRALAQRVGSAAGVELASGVYAGLLGPSYETPAEVRMLRTLGADAVGMSTVLETIAARHLGARVLAISCITNRAAGLSAHVPDHADVQAVAVRASDSLQTVLTRVLTALAKEPTP